MNFILMKEKINANAIRFESMSAFIAQLYFEESGYFIVLVG